MMNITEILMISTQDFPKRKAKEILPLTQDAYGTLDTQYQFLINYLETGDQRIIIITDTAKNKEIVAYAGFISRLNGKIWQAKNLQVYPPYKGMQFAGRLYKFIKEKFKKSIQSDIEQSPSGRILWQKTLPSLGMNPKIFDTQTQYIIDQSNPAAFELAQQSMYNTDDNKERYRYTWILETFDQYNDNSILTEGTLLMPYTGIWYTFKEKEINV